MTSNEVEQNAIEVFQKYITKGNSHKKLNDIMQAENIKYKEVPVTDNNFIGALTKANNGQVYIFANSKIDNIGRKNFTIAHELGHYFLGHYLTNNALYCNEKVIREESFEGIDIEREANYFASCFLMPKDKIISAFKSMLYYSKKSITNDFLLVTNSSYGIWRKFCSDFTKRYGVSEQALRFRLSTLKLVKFDL